MYNYMKFYYFICKATDILVHKYNLTVIVIIEFNHLLENTKSMRRLKKPIG